MFDLFIKNGIMQELNIFIFINMNPKIKKFLAPFLIIFILCINLALGFPRLSKFSAVDEPYWTYGRTSKFWNSVKAHKWKSTNVNDKPGITVAIISGLGLTQIDPMPYRSLRGDAKTDEQLAIVDKINFSFRLPIFIFTLLILPLFYVFLKKLFGATIAIIGFIFIGLSPIILGISLIINPDSLLWIFLPLSMLSYFIFQKENERKYLFISGIFLGLSLLTKYVSNILYIFYFLLPFLHYIFQEKKQDLLPYLKKASVDYCILVAISMIVFFILFPATWAHPSLLLKGTFLSKVFEKTWPLFAGIIILIMTDMFFLKSKAMKWLLDFISQYKKLILRIASGAFLLAILFVLLNTYSGMKFYDFEATIASPKGSMDSFDIVIFAEKIFADFYSLIFGVSPLILLSAIYALLAIFWGKEKISKKSIIIFYLSSFIFFYYLGSTVNDVVATVRYQITLYPLFFIIAAIGLAEIISQNTIKKYLPKTAVYFAAIAILFFSLWQIKPFYFAYASALLPNKYQVNFKDMGDGSYEAADYLNNLPDARNLTVWSDKGAVCAEFVGRCVIGFTDKHIKNERFDYFIVSSGRKSRSLKMSYHLQNIIDFKKAYSTDDVIKKITIGGRAENYVKIISAGTLYK